ncbi:MAG: L-aspartate oxidase [Planctomycetota bacterium]|nr:L-aspartate oxidase [Planctomycetota bacterium]
MDSLDSSAPLHSPRYLIPLDLRNVPQYRFDAVVVGSGAGGSTAALELAGTGASVALLSKAALESSNTLLAKGGMAAVLGEGDSIAAHVQDTLRVGCDLSDPEVVEAVISCGPAAVQALLAMGTELDRDASGALDLAKEGGHSQPRIVHAGVDATGQAIQSSLVRSVRAAERISSFEQVFAIDLLSTPEGRVAGVLCSTERSELVVFQAPQIILATGGAGQIYRETTNPVIATADGVAMAMRAGAVVRDMEFIQFHPTCLYIAGAARVLISEVVRGAGGVLRDRNGLRFMPEYHPAAELAPRDVVSRAVFDSMLATDDTSAYLDLSGLDRDPHQAFSGLSSICEFFGIDIATDPIPVRPGCHYQVGGIKVDREGRTSVPGLWAVGEVASSGLHGANRMGSNSLLEALVLGAATGAAVGEAVQADARRSLPSFTVREQGPKTPPVRVNVDDLVYSLKSLMWRDLGVRRTGSGMNEALKKMRFWSRAVQAMPLEDPRAWEFSNMLQVAQLITLSALAREESRGVHHRSDFEGAQPEWLAHTELTPMGDETRIEGVGIERRVLERSLSTS